MNEYNELLGRNRAEWEENAASGDEYTRPWLHLTPDLVRRFAEGSWSGFHPPCGEIDHPMLKKIRRALYGGIAGKRVLCLASGGGQQSAVFSLLGAEVTVVDLSPAQLAGDERAARHYGYSVRTVEKSMTDLSAFSDNAFDIVFQPISLCFVPDVLPVYRAVHRVLAPGGLYSAALHNPATYVVDFDGGDDGWDGKGYRIATPYRGGAIRMDENGRENMDRGEPTGEFRHLLIDSFCNLTEAGFAIRYVWEDERNLVGRGEDDRGHHIVGRYLEVLSERMS